MKISTIKRGLHELCLLLKANKINAHYLGIPALKNRVNIYEYHPELIGYDLFQSEPYNLGDSLGRVIVEFLLEKKNIKVDKNISKTKHLNVVGSNIFCSYQDTTIWGSGIMYPPTKFESFFQKLSKRKLDIRAVRGPLTSKILEEFGYFCPTIYGDPAILMPFVYNPNIEKTKKYLIIPQFAVEREFRNKYSSDNVISMNTNDYKIVIDKIKSCECVYTSSLHGIILAESYGVPAVFFRGLGHNIDFKYLDYYYSTGRYDIKIAESFEEALLTPPPTLPNLSKMQQDLLDTFPYDLWE